MVYVIASKCVRARLVLDLLVLGMAYLDHLYMVYYIACSDKLFCAIRDRLLVFSCNIVGLVFWNIS